MPSHSSNVGIEGGARSCQNAGKAFFFLILHEFLGDLTKTNSSTKRLGVHGVVLMNETGWGAHLYAHQGYLMVVVVASSKSGVRGKDCDRVRS